MKKVLTLAILILTLNVYAQNESVITYKISKTEATHWNDYTNAWGSISTNYPTRMYLVITSGALTITDNAQSHYRLGDATKYDDHTSYWAKDERDRDVYVILKPGQVIIMYENDFACIYHVITD